MLNTAPLGLGESTIAHEVPFQCSMRLWRTVALTESPTAQQSEADVHVTALKSRAGIALAFGEGTIDHVAAAAESNRMLLRGAVGWLVKKEGCRLPNGGLGAGLAQPFAPTAGENGTRGKIAPGPLLRGLPCW
jgi:hypothetical protein